MKQKFICLSVLANSFLLYSQGISTVSRNDAGASGPGVLSGFYEAAAPVNFPSGATSWWHLLDVRHTNSANNFAMQFSGSFFDQNLWFRKTNNNASQPWSRILMEDSSGKVGVGGVAGQEKLTVTGDHSGTTFLMHADNGPNPHAYLSLWASEPSQTFYGVGIGSNVRNFYNGTAFQRISNSAGGSYIRLIDNEINFNLISNNGANKRGLTISTDGALVNGNVNADNGNVISSRSSNEGGSLSLVNPLKTGAQIQRWTIYNMSGAYGNSLQFWHYSADGSRFGSRLKISDDGDMALYGKFEAKEVKVTTSPTADFVFEEGYNLPKLEDVEKHIREKKHLPEIASAKEMEKEGVNVGEFQIKLLQKIEELTLYSIEQNKRLESQRLQIEHQAEQILKLELLINSKK